jgi:hypothetical protein
MSRLLIHVEGETEETFINNILRPHLVGYGYTSVGARLMGNARQRRYRGGIRGWNQVRKDIIRYLKEDSDALTTTMVDYYGLPKAGERAWPGRHYASLLPFRQIIQKASTVEKALLDDISKEFESGFAEQHFIPYVVMHEFEGMLFSDCCRFGDAIGRSDLVPQFQQIRSQFESPEHIDDSPTTAPSKRIEQMFPAYQKSLFGTVAVSAIGLDPILTECAHFREWLESLEAWPTR